METIKARGATKAGLEICDVFTRWQVHCKKCRVTFYVDAEPNSTGEEILGLQDIHYDPDPSESSLIELV